MIQTKEYLCPEEAKSYSFVDADWFLDAFADEVSSGAYEKLPYVVWKALAHAKSKHFLIEILSNYSSTNSSIIIKEAFLQHTYIFGSYVHEYFTTGKVLYCSEDFLNHMQFDDFVFDYWGDYEPPFVKEKTLEQLLSATPSITLTNDIWNQPVTITTLSNEDTNTIIETKKENKNMNTDKFFNFDFGPVSGSKFRLSPYGIAVATANNGWVAYNDKTQEFFNVEILNFDASKLIYKMPVAQNDIAIGDILIHSGKPVFVRSINKSSGTVSVVDYVSASVMDILPIKSPFGFNFYTKVCALMDFKKMNADADNPFGNILPFLMLSKDGQDFDPMILFFMNNNTDFIKNPMMLYFLMSQKGNNDNMLPFLMMANGNNLFGAPEPKSN